MEFDLLGRLENMRLPDGKAAILYSVYEAVSNSVHAIEDRFGLENVISKGRIDIVILTDDEGLIESISIQDNGIGLRDSNLQAFDTCDTRFKKDRGGKGIGRLIWFKVFDSIEVSSDFKNSEGDIGSIGFKFVPDQEETLQDLNTGKGKEVKIGTKIVLSDLRPDKNFIIRPTTFLRDLSLHFFSYFMSDAMPRLTVTYGDRSPYDLGAFIKERIEDPIVEALPVEGIGLGESLKITHLYVERSISKELKNSILLVAHNRLVKQIEIEKKFALMKLADRKAYVGIVRGVFLDQRVDQERTGFKLTDEQIDSIHEAALNSAEAFLEDHIRNIRKIQRVIITQLLEEHPQLAIKVGNIDEYVETLGASMDNEDMGRTLFTLLYRDERKTAKEVTELAKVKELSDEIKERAQDTLSRIKEQAKGRLAEYVVKRRQILDVAKTLLRYTSSDGTSYQYEKTVHDLICPMRKIYSTQDYQDHNLWIIDDLLAYYSFFASDKQIRAIAPESEDRKEPDIIFFNPMGFRREGTDDPVVLVEFKRPGDETPSKNPVEQVLEYIEKLQSTTVRDIQGEVVSEIGKNTAFQCYVICDLTEGTRRLLERSVAGNPTPDGAGYFGYAQNHKAAIHIISYGKLLRDAELRNKIFFDKLGLVI